MAASNNSRAVGSMGSLGLLMTKEGLDALPRRRLCESPRGAHKTTLGGFPDASQPPARRWSRNHYHVLALLWLSYAITMYFSGVFLSLPRPPVPRTHG